MSEVSWENPFLDKEVGFPLSPLPSPISLASLALEEKTLRYNYTYLRIFLEKCMNIYLTCTCL